MTQHGLSPRVSCREALGPAGFRRLASVVDQLPTSVDRDAVYRAINLGLSIQALHRLFNSEWCQRRETAMENLRQAILQLRAVLEDAPRDLPYDVEDANELLGPIEDAHRRLAQPWAEDDAGVQYPALLLLARSDFLSQGLTGRPAADWRAVANRLLRAAHVSRAKIVALLRAAGLTEASPERKQRNARK